MVAPRRNSEPRLTGKPQVKPEEVCMGCIAWLPPKDTLNSGIQCSCTGCLLPSALDHGGYDHPVVVVKVRQKHGSTIVGDLVCDVACVTTFGNTELASYFSQRISSGRHRLKASLPIFHALSSTEGTDHFPQLRFEEGDLAKQSYIRIKHLYAVDISNLRQYGWRPLPAYKLRLCKASYNTLAKSLGLSREEYVNTDMVTQEASRRLLLLAGSRSAIASHPRPVKQPTPPNPIRTSDPPRYYPQYPPEVMNSCYDRPRYYGSTSAPRAPVWNSNSYHGSHDQRHALADPDASPGFFGLVVLVTTLIVIASSLALWMS